MLPLQPFARNWELMHRFNIMEETKVLHKKKLVVPKLRFKGFDDEWVSSMIEENFVFKNGLNKEKEYFGHGTPIINFTDVYHLCGITKKDIKGLVKLNQSEIDRFVANKGDVFFTRTSETIHDIGMASVLLENIPNCVFSGFVLRATPLNDKIVDEFKKYCFRIGSVRKEIVTKSSCTTRALTSGTLLNKVVFKFPKTKEEQEKIASFLSAVDEKIQQLSHKKELLEQYKKGVMQQLFSGKLRFKDEKGKAFPKWEEKLLGEIAERNSTKNKSNSVNFVLTNSATQGIVSQDEYFDREIANQNNLEGYYIVAINDFVYNPRISVHAPVGPIKRNKLREGVMSPLYSVFRFKVKNLEYFEFYFETIGWHEYLESVSNMGARHDRMNISGADFFKMPIPFPCEQERKKITNFLTELSSKIESSNKEITQTQTFKKGLLQQMFV